MRGAGILYPVTELVVGQNANLRYLSVQELDEQTWILGSQRAAVARDANLDWAVLGLGGGGGRIHLDATLDGEGAEARITVPTRRAPGSTSTTPPSRSTPPPARSAISPSAAS